MSFLWEETVMDENHAGSFVRRFPPGFRMRDKTVKVKSDGWNEEVI